MRPTSATVRVQYSTSSTLLPEDNRPPKQKAAHIIRLLHDQLLSEKKLKATSEIRNRDGEYGAELVRLCYEVELSPEESVEFLSYQTEQQRLLELAMTKTDSVMASYQNDRDAAGKYLTGLTSQQGGFDIKYLSQVRRAEEQLARAESGISEQVRLIEKQQRICEENLANRKIEIVIRSNPDLKLYYQAIQAARYLEGIDSKSLERVEGFEVDSTRPLDEDDYCIAMRSKTRSALETKKPFLSKTEDRQVINEKLLELFENNVFQEKIQEQKELRLREDETVSVNLVDTEQFLLDAGYVFDKILEHREVILSRYHDLEGMYTEFYGDKSENKGRLAEFFTKSVEDAAYKNLSETLREYTALTFSELLKKGFREKFEEEYKELLQVILDQKDLQSAQTIISQIENCSLGILQKMEAEILKIHKQDINKYSSDVAANMEEARLAILAYKRQKEDSSIEEISRSEIIDEIASKCRLLEQSENYTRLIENLKNDLLPQNLFTNSLPELDFREKSFEEIILLINQHYDFYTEISAISQVLKTASEAAAKELRDENRGKEKNLIAAAEASEAARKEGFSNDRWQPLYNSETRKLERKLELIREIFKDLSGHNDETNRQTAREIIIGAEAKYYSTAHRQDDLDEWRSITYSARSDLFSEAMVEDEEHLLAQNIISNKALKFAYSEELQAVAIEVFAKKHYFAKCANEVADLVLDEIKRMIEKQRIYEERIREPRQDEYQEDLRLRWKLLEIASLRDRERENFVRLKAALLAEESERYKLKPTTDQSDGRLTRISEGLREQLILRLEELRVFYNKNKESIFPVESAKILSDAENKFFAQEDIAENPNAWEVLTCGHRASLILDVLDGKKEVEGLLQKKFEQFNSDMSEFEQNEEERNYHFLRCSLKYADQVEWEIQDIVNVKKLERGRDLNPFSYSNWSTNFLSSSIGLLSSIFPFQSRSHAHANSSGGGEEERYTNAFVSTHGGLGLSTTNSLAGGGRAVFQQPSLQEITTQASDNPDVTPVDTIKGLLAEVNRNTKEGVKLKNSLFNQKATKITSSDLAEKLQQDAKEISAKNEWFNYNKLMRVLFKVKRIFVDEAQQPESDIRENKSRGGIRLTGGEVKILEIFGGLENAKFLIDSIPESEKERFFDGYKGEEFYRNFKRPIQRSDGMRKPTLQVEELRSLSSTTTSLTQLPSSVVTKTGAILVKDDSHDKSH